MIRLVAAVLVVAVAYVAADGEDTYAYNYKVTEFYADMLAKMTQGVDARKEQLSHKMEKHSRFNMAAEKMAEAIEEGQDNTPTNSYEKCSNAQDTANLKKFKEDFEASRKTCTEQAKCQNNLQEVVSKIVVTVQGVDADAFKAASACSDDACKLAVYDNSHQQLFQLYQDSMPALRVASDQALVNTQCSSALIMCMVDKNGNNMKLMYKTIAELEDCNERGVPRPSSVQAVVPASSKVVSKPSGGRKGWYS